MSTVSYPPLRRSPREDASALYRAFFGVIGCDKAAVVNILAHRDATERALIQQEYRARFSDDLLFLLSTKLRRRLQRSVLLWMHDPVGRDAIVLRQGLSPQTQNLKAVTEVICSRTPSEIRSIREQYDFSWVSLERDIERQAFGEHRQLLLAYVRTPRGEGLEYDGGRAAVDSMALFQAGVGTDAETFIRIFSERSRAQLAAVISAYHDRYGNSLRQAVKYKTRGPFKYALLTILSCSKNPARYFAKVLYKAIGGFRTDDTTLIRVIVTRTEIDMRCIKAEYLKKYNNTLYNAVRKKTSRHYSTFLLSLLGPNHEPNDR